VRRAGRPSAGRRYCAPVKPEVVSRTGLASAAGLLFAATLVIVIIALPVTILETLTPATGVIGLLGVSQLLGTVVLADLLARVLASSEPALARTWRIATWLTLGLGLVPLVGGIVLGRMSDGVQIETPLVVPLLAILAIPLIWVLVALWRTMQVPPAAAPAEGSAAS
jgi:hypothetical protein